MSSMYGPSQNKQGCRKLFYGGGALGGGGGGGGLSENVDHQLADDKSL